jgi:hypothetical protein
VSRKSSRAIKTRPTERVKSMSKVDLEARIAALEAEVGRLRAIVEQAPGVEEPAWKKIVGLFEDDPLFEEAMRLGREYRESTRPRTRKPKKV